MIKVRMMLLPHAVDLPAPKDRHEHHEGMLDLVAAIPAPIVIASGRRALIPTGLTIALPPEAEGQIRSRTGLAFQHGVVVLDSPQTVDAAYRGEIHVLLMNLGLDPFTVERGAPIALFVVAPALIVDWEWPLPAE
jgi:dUTP pyrophosphatase